MNPVGPSTNWENSYGSGRPGFVTSTCNTWAAAPYQTEWGRPPHFPLQVTDFADKVQCGIWALVANKADDHFTEELSTQDLLEELKLATARARETDDARLQKEVA